MEKKTDHNGRLEFNMGKHSAKGDVQIRNVRLEMTEVSDEAKELMALMEEKSPAPDEAETTETSEVTEEAAETEAAE